MVRQAVTREDYREVRDNFEDLYFDFTDPTAFRLGTGRAGILRQSAPSSCGFTRYPVEMPARSSDGSAPTFGKEPCSPSAAKRGYGRETPYW
jgi:hypothetical protein